MIIYIARLNKMGNARQQNIVLRFNPGTETIQKMAMKSM